MYEERLMEKESPLIIGRN